MYDRGIERMTLVFVTIMAALMLFHSGLSAGEHHYFDAILAIAAALFFVGIAGMVVWGRIAALNDKITARDRDIEMMKHDKITTETTPADGTNKFKELVEDVLIPAVLARKGGITVSGPDGVDVEPYADKFMECVTAVTGGGRAPTEEEQPMIAAQFNDLTGWYAQFVGEQTDISGDVVLNPEPFEHVPGRSEAHEAARKRGDNARATDAVKPLTKSQQRRRNASKGYGPITDDELRQQRNEKRRAARAAKKAAETTTTTTTQPGQTKLV